MTVRTDRLETMPALATLYRRAALQAAADTLRRRSRPAQLPERAVVVEGHTVPASAVRAWREGMGPVDPATLPSVLVHTQVFGAAMELMADPEFPLPLPGLVHLTNSVRHHRPVPAGEPLTVTARAAGLVPHHAGTAVDMVVTVESAEAHGAGPLWEGMSRYLARGVHLSPLRPERPEREEFTPPARTAEWTFGAGAGRRYAAVSGDWNPIHLAGPAGRIFGQPGAIAHGMLLSARMLQRREPADAGFAWDIFFEAPVVLPARVAVRYSDTGPEGTHVTGWDPRRGRRHFTGRILPLAG